MNNPNNPNPNQTPNENPNKGKNHVKKEKVASYGNGYSDGRVSETNLKNDALEVRDQNNVASGLVIGLSIAALMGLCGLGYYLWGRPPQTTPVIVVPAPAASPSPAASKEPAKQTTIIEKTNTIERVPSPATAPAPPQSAPNVNIKIDAPPPAQAPAPQQSAPNINIKVDAPKSQKPGDVKTDVKVTAPAPQNTAAPTSPPKTSTPTASPNNSNSKPQTSPNPSKPNSDTSTGTDSTP